MKQKIKSFLVVLRHWSLPAFLLLCSLVFYSASGHSFLGLVFLGLTAVAVCYNILRILKPKHPKLTKTLWFTLTCAMVLAGLVVSVTLGFVLNAARGDEEQNCDYVVVLGAAVRPWGPTYPLQERVAAAYEYMQAHPQAIIIVSGGQGSDEPMSEARCMYDMLIRKGADPQRIWLEDQATSTWENMKFTMELIEKRTGQSPKTLGVISNEYHLFRARLFASRCGVEPVGIPAHTYYLSLRINNYLREVAGVWHYLILGGQYND